MSVPFALCLCLCLCLCVCRPGVGSMCRYNHLRAVAVGSGSDKYSQQVWMASDMGASLWNRFPNPPNAWRYFFGARYAGGGGGGGLVVAVVDGGAAWAGPCCSLPSHDRVRMTCVCVFVFVFCLCVCVCVCVSWL